MNEGLRRILLAVVMVASLVLGSHGTAFAGKLDDLVRVLRKDSSYKVRVQAALVLGRLGDRNAVPALVEALVDSNNMVRAVAAQALGKLGAPEAGPAVQKALDKEKDPFARSQMQNALGVLGKSGTGEKKAGMYLALGPFTGGAQGAGQNEIGLLRSALREKLGTLGGVTFEMSERDEAAFKRGGGMGFFIDGNVTRLDDGVVGGVTEVNCDVKVQVFKWPSRSLISWTSAGAAVQAGAREREKEIARRDCLEAAAGQLGDDLKRFFMSQGG